MVVVGGGNFLKDAAGFGPETVPHTGHDEAGVAGVEGALLPVAREVEDAVQHLEGFLFEFVIVRGVFLPGELHHDFFAVFAVDAVDD